MSPFACVWVDFFAAAAAERCEPALREGALAVVAPTAHAKILEANAAARAGGVGPGMTETEARARCPALVSRPWVDAHVAAARAALLEAALGVSPRVEDAGAGVVHVDAAGLERLHGSPAALGARLLRQAWRVGFAARVALAGSRAAARLVAASAAAAVTVVPPGRERAALAPVPLAALALAPDLAATLARWGVTTLGGLAALPREGLGARLGPAGLRAHDQALGRDREPFRAWTPPPFWEEAQELEWELDALDALAGVLARALARLAARLEAAQLAAEALDVELTLATGGRHARTVPLATPTCEVKPLLALLRLDLERHPPPAAVTRVVLGARTVRARAGQGGLWQPPAPAPRALGAVLARLAALVGGDNVGSPALLDSHRPDAHAMLAFAPPDEPGSPTDHRGRAGGGGAASRRARSVGEVRGAARSISPRLGEECPSEDGREAATPTGPAAPAGEPEHRLVLRRARPPQRVEVETAGERPASVELGGGVQRVVACAGPWRASGEWWDVGEWAREEWDVALAGGALCRLAWDRRTGAWCLDGTYD